MHFHLNKGKLSIFLNNEEKYKLNKEQIKTKTSGEAKSDLS